MESQLIERREEQQISSHDGRMRPTLYSCHGHGHGRRRCCCRREVRPCRYGGRRRPAWDRQRTLAAARRLLRRARAGSCVAAADWTADATGTAAEGRQGGAAAGEGRRAERCRGVGAVHPYPAAEEGALAPAPRRREPCLQQDEGVWLPAAVAAAGVGARRAAAGALAMPPARRPALDLPEAAVASAVVTSELPAGRCRPNKPFIRSAYLFVAGALTTAVQGPLCIATAAAGQYCVPSKCMRYSTSLRSSPVVVECS